MTTAKLKRPVPEGETRACKQHRPHYAVDKYPKQKKAKRVTNPRRELIRSVIGEVCGFSPYEKRVLELIRTGSTSAQKRSLKLCKKRLGTMKRAKRKQQNLITFVQKQRRAAQEKSDKDAKDAKETK